jgi:hypothetical protein
VLRHTYPEVYQVAFNGRCGRLTWNQALVGRTDGQRLRGERGYWLGMTGTRHNGPIGREGWGEATVLTNLS